MFRCTLCGTGFVPGESVAVIATAEAGDPDRRVLLVHVEPCGFDVLAVYGPSRARELLRRLALQANPS
jgi:hypothetical protein